MKELNIYIIEDDLLTTKTIEFSVKSVNNNHSIFSFTSVEFALKNHGIEPDIIFLDHLSPESIS